MKKRQIAATALRRSGGLWLLDHLWGNQRLTVLGYHRICDPHSPDFEDYAANVSATPAMFARQMDFVKQHFNVIDLDTLRKHVTQDHPLPSRPLLITFDDGYIDNYEHAYPVLRERDLPAVFFLVSEWVGSNYRPWWDRGNALFLHTTQERATLPLIGARDLSTPEARARAREDLFRQLKTLPNTDRAEQVAALADVLAVTLPEKPAPRFLNWDQARELVANGVACQPHTMTHPILTRIPLADVEQEVRASAERIVAETGVTISAFAYPNGTIHDYNPAIMQTVRELDIPLAFTLTPGPLRVRKLQRHVLEIPRMFLIYKDSFDVFVTKLMGLPALTEERRFYG